MKTPKAWDVHSKAPRERPGGNPRGGPNWDTQSSHPEDGSASESVLGCITVSTGVFVVTKGAALIPGSHKG